MSMGIAHFSVGASITIIALLLSQQYTRRESKLIAAAGGVWAMLPDIHWVTPISKAFHKSVWANISFGHHFMDTVIDPHDSKLISAIALASFLVTLTTLTILQVRVDD